MPRRFYLEGRKRSILPGLLAGLTIAALIAVAVWWWYLPPYGLSREEWNVVCRVVGRETDAADRTGHPMSDSEVNALTQRCADLIKRERH